MANRVIQGFTGTALKQPQDSAPDSPLYNVTIENTTKHTRPTSQAALRYTPLSRQTPKNNSNST